MPGNVSRRRTMPKIGTLSVAALIANIALATASTEAKAQVYYTCPPGYYFSPGYGCIANSPPPQAYYYYVPSPPPPPVVVSPAPLFDMGLFFGFGDHDHHEDRHWHGDRD
jgi:hypothetical protein